MQYDFNLPPGGALNLDVKGRFFKYRSGTGAIRVRASKGGYVDLLPGQGVWSLDYGSLNVQDRSGANNSGVLIAGDFDFHDDRITGTVEVVDGGKARTMSGQAFIGSTYVGGIAGQMPYLQIFNPTTSLKNVIVKSFSISSSVAGTVDVRSQLVQAGGAAAPVSSKLIGGAVGEAKAVAGTVAALLGVGIESYIVGANQSVIFTLTEPIVLRPGYGVSLDVNVANALMAAAFEWYEEAL